jgi:hypothetical protein
MPHCSVMLCAVQSDEERFRAPPKSESERAALHQREEEILLGLRMHLRSVCTRLIKQFKEFAECPERREDPEYYMRVVTPLSLSDIRERNNDRRYLSVKEFLNDIDLVVTNTRELLDPKRPASKALVNQVCHMQDTCLALVSQFDRSNAQACELIAQRRRKEEAERRAAAAAAASASTSASVAVAAASAAAAAPLIAAPPPPPAAASSSASTASASAASSAGASITLGNAPLMAVATDGAASNAAATAPEQTALKRAGSGAARGRSRKAQKTNASASAPTSAAPSAVADAASAAATASVSASVASPAASPALSASQVSSPPAITSPATALAGTAAAASTSAATSASASSSSSSASTPSAFALPSASAPSSSSSSSASSAAAAPAAPPVPVVCDRVRLDHFFKTLLHDTDKLNVTALQHLHFKLYQVLYAHEKRADKSALLAEWMDVLAKAGM